MGFVSTTVPLTVGVQLAAAAVTVIVVLFEPRLVLPLNVSHVSVTWAVFAFGINLYLALGTLQVIPDDCNC